MVSYFLLKRKMPSNGIDRDAHIGVIPPMKKGLSLILIVFFALASWAQVTLPYVEDFEGATVGNPGVFPTGWVNVVGDGTDTCAGGGATGHTTCFDWQVNSGATPSVAPIGPSADRNGGAGNYIYYEDSGNDNDTVEILTPTFNLSGTTRPRVSFYTYHHWRGDAGAPNDLFIDVMNSAGTTVLSSSIASYPTDFASWMYQFEDLTAFINSGTIRLRLRMVTNGSLGRHDVAIDDFTIQDEPAPVVDPAVCTPIDDSVGAILTSHGNQIFSTNLTTGKATLLTTTPVPSINSLAIDAVNQLIYYVETIAVTTALRAWDYANDQHIIIDADVSNEGIILGSTLGIGGGAGGWSNNGSLYLGVEEGDAGELSSGIDIIYQVNFVPGSNGRTVAGGRVVTEFANGATHDWGDVVNIGNSLFDFSPASNDFASINITTDVLTNTAGITGLGQAGADRNGGLWSVGTTLQQRNTTNGATIGTAINITTDGTTAIFATAFDASRCSPAISSISSQVWHDTDSDGDIDGDEPGISGVTLEIYDDINGNGSIDVGDTLLGTTVTNGSGFYTFNNLLPGDYIVEVDTTTLPAGSTNTFDEDDGTTSPDDMTAVDITIDETHGSADFGYNVPPGPTADKTVALAVDADGSGNITEGDTLTYTITLQNSVQGGVALATTMTDVVPAGLTYVGSSIAGGDTSNDSDPDATVGGAPDGLQWTVASLNPGVSEIFTFQVTVDLGSEGTTINNQASYSGSNYAASLSDDPNNGTNDPTGPGQAADPTPVSIDSPDNDNDGIPDNIDVDDDNDGIPDVSEADGNNPNGDEDGDNIPNWKDVTDNGNGGDGSTTDYTDDDNNGIPDVFDFDGDGRANHLDVDADDDGIPDITEAGGTDTDRDGIVDSMYDTDNDGVPDSVDVDQTGGTDANTDGIDDSAQGGPDSDGDGIQNSSDPDADGDGWDDNLDNIDNGGPGEITNGTPLANGDFDMDGLPNAIDIDADDDGIPDNVEAQTTLGYTPPTGSDSDNDGLDNAYDPDDNNVSGANDGVGASVPLPDNDGTENDDYLDIDSDGDNIPDIRENGNANNVLAGVDTDNDGLDDNFEGANLDDPIDINDEINTPADDLPDGDNDRNSGGDLDYRDLVDLESYTDDAYGTLDQVYYRQTDGSIDEFFEGGAGFPAVDSTGYDVVYYDSQGDLIFNDTNATVDGSGFIESEFTVADGLDSNNINYGEWTAVVLFDGVSPLATLAAQLASPNTIVSDTFDVYSIATIEFTNENGVPVSGYDVPVNDDSAYLEIADPDQNDDPGVVDSILVTVTDSATGDNVTVTLFETGPDTGVFAFSSAVSGTRLAIPLAICPGVPPNPANTGDGTICVTRTSNLQASYTDPNDPGPVSDSVFNPVTVNSFSARLDRAIGEWIIEWTTATETGNMGFNLYTIKGDRIQRLNLGPIPSKVIDSFDETFYQFRVKADVGDAFILEDVDIFGKRQGHGPFETVRDYGRVQPASPIDWSGIRAEHAAQDQARFEEARDELVDSSQRQPSTQTLFVKTEKAGVHRITQAQLVAAGFDTSRIDLRALALTNRGQAVPFFIGSDGKGSAEIGFGSGSYLEFIAADYESLYSKENVYKLELLPALAQRISSVNPALSNEGKIVTSYLETVREGEEELYSFSSPNGDPWFAKRMLAWGGPFEETLDITVDHIAPVSGTVTLDLGLWGVTDWPASPDHHVEVYFNGEFVHDAEFDGLVDLPLSIRVAKELLVEGQNQITLKLPLDTGLEYDLVHLDHWHVTYPRKLIARDNQLTFKGRGPGFRVDGFSRGDGVVVYRQFEDGRVERVNRLETSKSAQGFSVSFGGSAQTATYFVLAGSSWETPSLTPVMKAGNLEDGPADYLIISHPNFIGPALDRLVTLREADGYRVKVVDVEQVYAEYGHGFGEPEAIRNYIRYANNRLRTEMVLLVGGDTNDYHDYLGHDGISFIPTFYAQTDNIVRFAPVDALFTDLSGDQLPDLVIGRLPVRTEAELSIQVSKIEAFETRLEQRTALFAADLYDGSQEYSFAQDSDAMVAQVPTDWLVSKLYLDHIDVSQARPHLLNAINLGIPRNGNHEDLSETNRTDGVSLVSFAGHSGPKDWTFAGLFGSGDAAQLTNQDHPALFIQWGCWNTYFVSPRENTLGHELMLNPLGGAAGVLGASTLTEAAAERELALLLYARIFQPGKTLGEAVLEAKREFANQYPEQLDVLLGWTTLADPAMVLQPK